MRIFWEGRPKSTGSKIKSQVLRMPNPGKSQGPSFPVSDGHHPRNLCLSHGFPSPWRALRLPPSHPHVTGCTLPWRCCLFVSHAMKPLPPAPGNVSDASFHNARVLCTHTHTHTQTHAHTHTHTHTSLRLSSTLVSTIYLLSVSSLLVCIHSLAQH